LYFDPEPKRRRQDLYDFEKELESLIRCVDEGPGLIVVSGLRRTGKTSLVLTGLNETSDPYVVLDGNLFALRPAITRRELVRSLQESLNELARERRSLGARLARA
jgi:AAA+ ATPase superfamily predicted ATPase